MDPFWGAASALAAAISWAVGICFFKKYGEATSATFLAFFKGVVSCLSVASLLLMRSEPFPSDPSVVGPLVLSGLIGITLGDTSGYYALKKLGANVSATVFSLSTPIAVALAWIFLGERLETSEILGMAMTTLAVVGILSAAPPKNAPRATVGAVIVSLISPLSHAIGIILSKHALEQVDPLWGLSIRLFPATVPLFLMYLARREGWPKLSRKSWAGLTMGSLIAGTLGFLLLTVSVKGSKAGIATAISSTYPVWVVPTAAYLLRERPRTVHILMTSVAVVGIFLMIF